MGQCKEIIEKGVLIDGVMVYKGSDPHKASVTGDTVGDPFKDTSGPSMNILIKLMSIVSLIIAPHIAVNGGHGGEMECCGDKPKMECSMEKGGHDAQCAEHGGMSDKPCCKEGGMHGAMHKEGDMACDATCMETCKAAGQECKHKADGTVECSAAHMELCKKEGKNCGPGYNCHAPAAGSNACTDDCRETCKAAGEECKYREDGSTECSAACMKMCKDKGMDCKEGTDCHKMMKK